MSNIKWMLIASIALIVIGQGISVFFAVRNDRKINNKIQAIEIRKVKIINTDSVRSVIESRILDSLKVRADQQDAKIAAITKSLKVTRRQNENLQMRLDSIHIFMPDF